MRVFLQRFHWGKSSSCPRMSIGKSSEFPFAWRALSALVVLVALCSTNGYSQINSATVAGTVKDSSEAAVQGAAVTVLQTATGAVRNSETNETGFFTVPFLQPGDYKLTVSKKGFQSATASVTLQVNQIANLPFTLTVGSTTESITVATDSLQLQTETSSLGTVIGNQQISDLPLNGRQFIQLLQLAPGTVPVSVSQTALSDIGSSGSNVTPSINGGSGRSNLFFVDGLYATDPFFSSLSISPSIDAIQEFQEQTHADQAQFGGSTGGTVNLSTKSGTNSFHGSGYEFFRNKSIAATKAFNGDNTVPDYNQNQFGGTFGGPILHNKLFFFGFYDGYRQTDGNNNTSHVPTDAERSGDFSDWYKTIYDPATYNASTGTISAFENNTIPTDRLNSGMVALMNAYYPASNTDCSNLYTNCNYVYNANSTTNQDQYSVRIDYSIGKNDLLYGRWTRSKNVDTSPGSLPINSWVTGAEGTNAGGTWVHTFSPTLVSQVTIGYNSFNHPQDETQVNAETVFNDAGFGEGFTSTPGGIKVPKVPGVSIEDYVGIGSGWGPIGPQSLYQFSGSVTKQLGAHALSFGAALYHTWMYTNWAQDDISFTSKATWNPTSASGGNGFASLLLGLPNSADRQLGNSGVNLSANIAGIYFQDSWKMHHRVTVNYGLRWDYTQPVKEDDNRFSGFDIHTDTWYIAKNNADIPSYNLPSGVALLDRNTITKRNLTNFSPRLGLSWSITPKTVVNAGVGVAYDNWSGAEQAAQNARGGWPSGASQNVSSKNEAGVDSGVTAQNPFAGLTTDMPTTPFLYDTSGNATTGGSFLDTQWKNAYSWQWNLLLQRDLGAVGTVKVAYVGSSTSRAAIQVPSNVSKVLAATYTLPFSQMSTFNTIGSVGHTTYNALQAQYQKSNSKGLTINTSFTWSKHLSVGCSGYWESCNIQNPYDLRSNRSVDSIDVPIVLSVAAVYELPFGKGKPYANTGTAAAILGGWKTNLLFAGRTGTPFSPGVQNNNTNAHGGSARPNVSGSTSGPKTRAEWFNTSAFSQPEQYTYGNSGRNSLRGPAYTNYDYSLFREFKLFERYSLEFRAESFNIFNHVSLSNPNSTLGNENFGKISSASSNPRRFQFAGTFRF